MRQSEVLKMLRKVEEVNALFVFGARVIPYLEELVMFVQETAPILEEMNSSIEESSRKMPFAVEKLDKVTETTETATAGMLDLIDQILTSLDRVMEGMTELEESYKKRLEKEKALVLMLARALDGEDVTEAANVETELKNLIDLEMSETSFQTLNDYLLTMQGDVFEIMNALQVQDITTQQIMGANSLIEAVQEKLGQLVSKFADIDDEVDIPRKKMRAFDPNASYEDKTNVQAMADKILAGNAEETDSETNKESEKTEDKPKKQANRQPETVDQAEIDKLLQNMKS
ncbi:MAG: hypothetical protein DWQ10_14460 [Calditrichaeota bacterium]|nr:MAG: hypothetical protein DWQ10_14460 [Calditrichota bacterium]